jgi:hypothetical protein
VSDLVARLRQRAKIAKAAAEAGEAGDIPHVMREAADALEALARLRELDRTYVLSLEVRAEAAEARAEKAEGVLVRLAIPTEALLMDKGSHKYITPEIISEWEAALKETRVLLAGREWLAPRQAPQAGQGKHIPSDKCEAFCLECEYNMAPRQQNPDTAQHDVVSGWYDWCPECLTDVVGTSERLWPLPHRHKKSGES